MTKVHVRIGRLAVLLLLAVVIGVLGWPAPTVAAAPTWTPIADKPLAFGGTYAVTGNDGRLYAFEDHYDTNSLYMEVYSPSTNTWDQPKLVPTGRSGFATVKTADGRIWIIGGYGAANQGGFDRVEVYNPATDVWECSVGDTSPGCSTQSLTPLPTKN